VSSGPLLWRTLAILRKKNLVKEHFVKSSLFFEKTLPKITAIA
jgi:hypothetical protein